jgi:predicted GNAT family N-acyltransferase
MSSNIILKIFHTKERDDYTPSELYRKYLLRTVNKDIENRLRYFSLKNCNEMDIIAFIDSNKIIAATGMRQAHLEKNVIITSFISVDPEYRKMGFGRELVRARFELMREKYPGKILEISPYTAMGELFIKTAIHEIAKEYPDVILRDRCSYVSDGFQYRAMQRALEEKRSFIDISEFD